MLYELLNYNTLYQNIKLDIEDFSKKFEISFEESKSLKKLFNNEFGVFITYDYLSSIVDEEDDYGDDDDEFDDDGYDGYGTNFYDDDDYDGRGQNSRNQKRDAYGRFTS